MRWYLRYPLSFRQLQEIMAERNRSVDHVTIWRWVQHYAPELNRRCGELGRRCRCRPVQYLNNIVEQDHRAIKRRVRASRGFRAFPSAWRTLQGIETMNMVRKGQVRWLPKDDIAGQAAFIRRLFGINNAA